MTPSHQRLRATHAASDAVRTTDCVAAVDPATIKATLTLLTTIVAVGDCEHVTEAAKSLGIPQPTVSRQIAKASGFLGIALLDRNSRGVQLSTAGHTLMPYLRRAVSEVEARLGAVSRYSTKARGRISITFQKSFGEDVVPSLIKAFRPAHPAVAFDLHQGGRSECLNRLENGNADVAFVSHFQDAPSMQAFELYEEDLVLVVGLDHPLASRMSITIQETSGERYIALKNGYGLRSTCENLWTKAHFVPKIAFEGEDVHTIQGLIAAGLGVGILPRTRRGRSPHRGTKEVHILSRRAVRNISMVWSTRAGQSDQAEAFRAMVRRSGRSLVNPA